MNNGKITVMIKHLRSSTFGSENNFVKKAMIIMTINTRVSLEFYFHFS